ncbi:MAG: hypothetical protein KI793_16415 [Rivularia sp. (in: Bacteria)]|nr:hypothetical protein [Rivularia sp. MS3]
MSTNKAVLRDEIRRLADEAFHRKLISGFGDGPDNSEFQIVIEGKPRHLPLDEARVTLNKILRTNPVT